MYFYINATFCWKTEKYKLAALLPGQLSPSISREVHAALTNMFWTNVTQKGKKIIIIDDSDFIILFIINTKKTHTSLYLGITDSSS